MKEFVQFVNKPKKKCNKEYIEYIYKNIELGSYNTKGEKMDKHETHVLSSLAVRSIDDLYYAVKNMEPSDALDYIMAMVKELPERLQNIVDTKPCAS